MSKISTKYNTISEILEERAILQPENIAYIFLKDGEHTEEKITYLELHQSAERIAVKLKEYCKKGDRAILFFPPGLDFIKGFFGCLYAGVIAVPSYPPKKNRHNEKLAAMMDDCRPKAILTSSASGYSKAIETINSTGNPTIEIDQLPDHLSEGTVSSGINPHDIAFIQYTSGSTGIPKGVTISHFNLIYNEYVIQKTFGLTSNSVVVGWLPFYHDMGLIGNILQPVFTGFKGILMSPIHFLQKPVRWLHAISKYKATVSGGPNFAFDLCVENIKPGEIKDLQLGSWNVAFNGSEPVRSTTLERFYNKFNSCGFKKNAFLPCYGMAEATLLVSGGEAGQKTNTQKFLLKDLQHFKEDYSEKSNKNAVELVSCGKCKYFDLVLVDENGHECEDGTVGEIWLHGASIAKGYWNRNKENEDLFGGKLIERKGNFLKTGDLGIIRDNELYIAGRIKDLIILKGKNYYPQDIESVVSNASEHILNGAVAAFAADIEEEERLVVVAEIEYLNSIKPQELIDSITDRFLEEFEFTPYDVVLIRKGTIPKTTSGKIRRKACKAAYINNTLIRIEPVSRESNPGLPETGEFNKTESCIYSILCEELKKTDVQKNSNLLYLGLDSIQLTRFAYRLGNFYNKEIPVDFIIENNTIAKIAEKLNEIDQLAPILKKSENKNLLATGMQELIWFNQQRNPSGTGYHIPIILEFNETINIGHINNTIAFLIKKHPVYRTNFFLKDGKVAKQVKEEKEYKIKVTDLSDLKGDELEKQYSELIRIESSKIFDLQNDQPIRTILFKKSDTEYSILFVIHHIIVDGTSIALFVKEFKRVYKAFLSGNVPSEDISGFDFFDYCGYHSTSSTELVNKKNFWLNEFKDEIHKIRLPFHYSQSISSKRTGNSYYFEVEKDLLDKIPYSLDQLHVNQFSLLLTAYYLLLNHLTSETDLIVGVPVSLRNRKEFEKIQGLMINTAMLRFKISGEQQLKRLVEKVYAHTRDVLQHSDYPFNQLLRDLEIPVSGNQLAISSVFFNYLDFVADSEYEEIFEAYKANPGVDLNFDLNLYALPGKGTIKFRLDYCREHVSQESIESIALFYVHFLSELVNSSHKTVLELNIAHRETKNTVVPQNKFNPFPESDINLSITDRFNKIVLQYPQRLAIKTNTNKFTYSELNTLSGKVAGQINLKADKDRLPIGLLFGHEVNMIISILAVLRSGNYYIPLDTDYPFERLCYILNDAEIKYVLTDSNYLEKAQELAKKSAGEITIINIDDEGGSELNTKIEEGTTDPLAYILYTSGSTGTPKGVMQTHKYVMHLTYSFTNSLHISKEDCFSLIPSFNFSASVMDLFGVLLNGASLYLVDIKKDGVLGLVERLSKQKVTVYHSVPTVFRTFCQQIGKRENETGMLFPNLRLIYLAGEQLLKNDVELYQKYFDDNTILVNGLGCTEYNICRQFFIDKATTIRTSVVPIGYKAIGVDVLIVDEDRNELKNYQPGEIAIKSKYLSKGYWNSPGLTKSKFDIIDPEIQDRVYYTGDLGQKTVDGCLLHLGRKDFQVKLRGQRIELAEIETALINIRGIARAVAMLQSIDSDHEYLCAYFISDHEADVKYLREKLIDQLPEFMVPSYFVQMDKFPLTDSGKVDRKNLPLPEFDKSAHYFPPVNTIQEELVTMWQDILKLSDQKISIRSNFFEFGGNSLTAIELRAGILKKYQVELGIDIIFRYPYIENISQIISKNAKNKVNEIRPCEKKESYAVSSIQKRMFFLQNSNTESTAYNMSAVLCLKGYVDTDKIENIFKILIGRHESLRSYFSFENGKLEQKVDENPDFKVQYFIQENNAFEEIIQKFIAPFDLTKPSLIRVGLIKAKTDNLTPLYYLVVDMHHIVADGISVQILVKEFCESYKGAVLDNLRLQYKDFVVWQRSKKKTSVAKEYWLGQFEEELPILDLPIDFIRKPKLSFDGANIEFTISAPLTKQLKEKAKQNSCTLSMTLLSVYSIFLSKICNQQDIVIGLPSTGRHLPDTKNILGVFVNTLPIRLIPTEDKTYSAFLKEIKESYTEAIKYQDYSLEDLLNDIVIHADPSRNPLFDTAFILNDHEQYIIDIPEVDVSEYEMKTRNSLFDLSLVSEEKNSELRCKFHYKTGLFREDTIKRFVSIFIYMANQIVENNSIVLGDISKVTEKERHRILNEFNHTQHKYPDQKLLHELFEEIAAKYPNSIAAIDGDKAITYDMLNKKANKFAHYLIRKGLQPEDVVCVYANDNIKILLGIIGILKAGGCFLPVDNHSPADRIYYMVSDSRARFILVDNKEFSDPGVLAGKIVFDDPEIDREEEENPEKNINSRNLAYIIYTSGSTGKPKGVMVEHRSVVNQCVWRHECMGYDKGSRMSKYNNMGFDASIIEIFPTLTIGGMLIFVPDSIKTEVQKLNYYFEQKDITISSLPPVIYEDFIMLENKSLSVIFTGGDKVKGFKEKNYKLYNNYGPTECTVVNTSFLIDKDYDNIPIGRPIFNNQAYILDYSGKDIQPVGVPGELCIGGDGLARGYINNERETKKRFINNPTRKGEKIYRSGDLARWLPDGNIEFLGRADNQISLRGYRIEPHEIETCIQQNKGIIDSKVISYKSLLYGFFTSDRDIKEYELKKKISEKLPVYMIPSRLIQLEKLPLNQNDKIDSKALEKIAGEINPEFVEPGTKTEKELVTIWKDILKVNDVGIYDNFFEHGGNSLKFTLLASKIQHVFEVNISIREMYMVSNVRELSKVIDSLIWMKNQEELSHEEEIVL